MKGPAIVVLLAGAAWSQNAPEKVELPVRLEDVLRSVERNYPPLLAALQEGAIADADVLAAEGRFDVVLRAGAGNDSLNAYPNTRFDLGFDQALQTGGMSIFGGYRVTDGRFAPYDGRLQTRDEGEWRTGFRVPLLRDRAFDSRRAELRKARIGRAVAQLSIDQQKLAIVQAATRRYWDWVAAARRAAVAEELLNIALTRDRFLREQVAEGALPQFEVADNERIVLQRRSFVVEAQRSLEQSAIELSLFYRDEEGRVMLPRAGQAPNTMPTPAPLEPSRLEDDIRAALDRRPEARRFAAQREQNQVDARLARNQRLPAVDLVTSFAREAGALPPVPASRIPVNELKTGISFELPFQRRTATGRLRAAEARERQLAEREKFAADQIRAEVRDAYSAVLAAERRARLLREEVEATRRVEDAERTRFELGDGTLFVLNQREQATADALVREIAALADYQRAYAAYEWAVAAALR